MSNTNQTLGLPQKFYTISAENGTFERVEVYRSPLSSVDSVLKTLAQDIPVFVKDLFVIPPGRNVHIAFSSKLMTLVTELPSLRINTFWTLVKPEDKKKKGYFTPAFHNRNNNTAIQLAPEWKPPANMKVFFCNHFDQSAQDGVFRHSRASLVAIKTDDVKNRNHYKLPITNLYENCKLCLGSVSVGALITSAVILKPFADQMQLAVDLFNSSTWNSDLIQHVDISQCNKLFRISVEDNATTVEPWPEWHEHLPSVSNNDFVTIPFHSLCQQP